MQAQTVQWIVTIAIFGVTTDRMSHVGSMHANLVFAPSLQLELY